MAGGRAATYDWPDSAREVPWDRLRDEQVDAVVYQRPYEVDLAREWLGPRVSRLPAVYVEHNTPRGRRAPHPPPAGGPERRHARARHPLQRALLGQRPRPPTRVIEHGVPDPGHLYSGELARAGVVVNEPVRRTRVAGTDLLPRFAERVPLDVFGMKVDGLPYGTYEDLPQHVMHAELAKRRVYLHPYRWTSLGLALIEAMTLGMPVVALAATEAIEAVPPEAGVLSTKVHVLADALAEFAGGSGAGEPGGQGRQGRRSGPLRAGPLPAGLGPPAQRGMTP
ncbi:glycosyltransferase [Nonomuraea salmonea]|uniref:glycosyltransferase n=1 Tax=Nonomuraea salmonea TaxID=46181 RepID=UPI002FE96380